jgi:hypothetical protein
VFIDAEVIGVDISGYGKKRGKRYGGNKKQAVMFRGNKKNS